MNFSPLALWLILDSPAVAPPASRALRQKSTIRLDADASARSGTARIKGIETSPMFGMVYKLTKSSRSGTARIKGIETRAVALFWRIRKKARSGTARIKGIETIPTRTSFHRQITAFPQWHRPHQGH